MTSERPIEEHIKEVMEPLVAAAPEEQLSNVTHITHPDGEVEFMPKKDLRRIDGPYVEYIDDKGENVVEIIDENDGKFDILNTQEYIPKNSESFKHKHLKDQPEFDL